MRGFIATTGGWGSAVTTVATRKERKIQNAVAILTTGKPVTGGATVTTR